MSRTLTIRAVGPRDYAALWPLLQQMGRTDSAAAVQRRLEELRGRSDHFLPVALEGDTLAGYAWAQDYGPHVRSGQRVVRLHDLFVLPQRRRRGIGSQLFAAAARGAAAAVHPGSSGRPAVRRSRSMPGWACGARRAPTRPIHFSRSSLSRRGLPCRRRG